MENMKPIPFTFRRQVGCLRPGAPNGSAGKWDTCRPGWHDVSND